MVFGMQCGFAMLCAGSIRQKNVKNIMLKNILDAVGGALGFFCIGFALAYGDGGKFVGVNRQLFLLLEFDNHMDFFYQFTFAATSATIVAGVVAERCKMIAYLCYSIMLTAFVYPVVVHAIWNQNGFLSALNENPFRGVGMIDFAGSGVVHLTGGMTGLVAAVILGPRIGRFHDVHGLRLEEPITFPPHSVALQVLGTFILWFGWYGFNAGSTLAISSIAYANIAALAAVTTTISAASGCASALAVDTFINYRRTGEVEYDLTLAMNGCLSGLVGITSGCSVVDPWAAIPIGIVSGWVYVGASSLLVQMRIDDAVDAIPVHLFNGIWGCLATGLLAKPSRVAAVYGSSIHAGWFYSWAQESGDANLLLCQVMGVLFIIGWTSIVMVPFFLILRLCNLLRVDPEEEKKGLDISHHKGSAYNMNEVELIEVDSNSSCSSTLPHQTHQVISP